MYKFILVIAKFIIFIITGKINVQEKQNIPVGQYILVAPHRTWWDPIWYAVAMWPNKFIFMAKKELFKNKIFAAFINKMGGFSVDRQNPGPSAIKIPVKELKNGKRSLIIFPSGSRHSQNLAAGAIVIAKLSGKPILPAVYQGPVKFLGLFKRKSTTIRFGQPFYIDKNMEEQEILKKIQKSFDLLDKEIDPNWKYVDPKPKKEAQ
ncbi:MAG: 1-acyl-sn-glycerol-3-phosphate acyltransferase [Lactobacillaceae bacterium]|jgi:1-acyl-sn-glycerol-3-phosphate acyltransferase|nr:1-acyl-sn-glycerol-3-phosphate acyltransferase [Lactobacillaceae bacterium]